MSLLLCLISIISLVEPDISHTSIKRALDVPSHLWLRPVVVNGLNLESFQGLNPAHFRVFSNQGGIATAIPFQIDRRLLEGRELGFAPPLEEGFGPYDEIVFMAFDMGPPLKNEHIPGSKKVQRITALDPVSGTRRYAYIALFDEPTPSSTERYISWDDEMGEVKAMGYELGYNDVPFSFTHLKIPREVEGNGEDIIDKLNIVTLKRMAFGLVSYSFDSKDYLSREVSKINGPIRLIRTVELRLKTSPFYWERTKVNIVFYPFGIICPLPGKLKGRATILNDETLHAVLDLSPEARGMSLELAGGKKGAVLDGKMGLIERSLDYAFPPYIHIAGVQGSLVIHLDVKERVARNASLYYLEGKGPTEPSDGTDVAGSNTHQEDAALLVRPSKGEMAVGYTVYHLERAGRRGSVFPLVIESIPERLFKREVVFDSLSVDLPLGYWDPFRIRIKSRDLGQGAVPTYRLLKKESTIKKRGWLPIVGGSSDRGLFGGIKYVNHNLLPGNFTLDTQVWISTRMWTVLSLVFSNESYKDRDDWGLKSVLGLRRRPVRYFYGIGNRTDNVSDISCFGEQGLDVSQAVFRRLGGDIWTGSRIGFRRINIMKGDDKRYPTTKEKYPHLYGIKGGNTLALGWSFLHDNRDDSLNPSRGGSREIYYERFYSRFSIDPDFGHLRMELRQFFDIYSKRDILALRFKIDLTRGNRIPFYELNMVGSEYTVRGFLEGRFRDRDAWTANVEWRHRFFKILGVNLFYDVGQTSHDLIREQINDYIHWALGLGLRIKLPARIIVRADLGFSRERAVFYLNWGQMF